MKVIILTDEQHEALAASMQLFAGMQEDRRGMPETGSRKEMVEEELFIQRCEWLSKAFTGIQPDILNINDLSGWPTESDAIWAYGQRPKKEICF